MKKKTRQYIQWLKRTLASKSMPPFLLGLIIGVLAILGVQYIRQRTNENSPKNRASSMHKIAERNQAAIQRQILDRGYERAKEIVKKDVDRKKITKPQADAITKKLDELYSQHKKDPSKQLTTDERQALNEWAKKQGVSNRYFIYIH